MSTNDERAARIAQIRARLEAATREHPQPWMADDSDLRSACGTEDERSVLSCCNIEQDALKFIAASVTDIAWLLAELEAATARAERYRVALYGPVPEGSSMPTLIGYECRLCCADAKPSEPDMHEDDCPVRRAALAEGA